MYTHRYQMYFEIGYNNDSASAVAMNGVPPTFLCSMTHAHTHTHAMMMRHYLSGRLVSNRTSGVGSFYVNTFFVLASTGILCTSTTVVLYSPAGQQHTKKIAYNPQ